MSRKHPTVPLTPELIAQLERYANRNNVSVASFAREIIEVWLAERRASLYQRPPHEYDAREPVEELEP